MLKVNEFLYEIFLPKNFFAVLTVTPTKICTFQLVDVLCLPHLFKTTKDYGNLLTFRA